MDIEKNSYGWHQVTVMSLFWYMVFLSCLPGKEFTLCLANNPGTTCRFFYARFPGLCQGNRCALCIDFFFILVYIIYILYDMEVVYCEQ